MPNNHPTIIREFNGFKISFGKGGKKVGDYVIFVNSDQVDDKKIFERLYANIMSQEDAIKFLNFLWEMGKIEHQEDENQAFNKINASTFNNEIKTYLYVIWHRLIIDDINYPLPRLNGRKRTLGQVYIVFAKKYNFDLPNEVKSIPEEVFLLGFPQGLVEKIDTSTWPKIYDLYGIFVESSKRSMGDCR